MRLDCRRYGTLRMQNKRLPDRSSLVAAKRLRNAARNHRKHYQRVTGGGRYLVMPIWLISQAYS
jgi:hypothetical protein